MKTTPFTPKLDYDLFSVEEVHESFCRSSIKKISYNGVNIGGIYTEYFGEVAYSLTSDKEIEEEVQHWYAQWTVAEQKRKKAESDAFHAKCAEEQEERRLALRKAVGLDK